MKKGMFLLVAMFILIANASAKNSNQLSNGIAINLGFSNSVNFIENGVEFFIFPNGEFSFNTPFNNVRVRRDFRGRINRVGRTVIRYNGFGNVDRIGSVFMRYHRGQLIHVGNLQIHYTNFGNPIFYGSVHNNFYVHNGVNINLNIGDVCDYNDAFFSHRDFRTNYVQVREDPNFYYYRANTNIKNNGRSEILRRRKPVAMNINRTSNIDTRRTVSNSRDTNQPISTRKSSNITRNTSNNTDRKTAATNGTRNESNRTNRNAQSKISTDRTRRN